MRGKGYHMHEVSNYKIRLLLTGTRGYRKGFIANYFLDNYKDTYDITEYMGDIRDFDEDLSAKKYDMVIHLAAMAGVRRSHEIPEEFWEVNVDASKKIFDACERNHLPIIYASSSSIYEWWLSPYAASKKAMEAIAPYSSLGLRFHTVYGPNSRTDMLYRNLEEKNPKITYLTNHTRDWTHVEDVCSAIHLCIRNYHKLAKHKAIDVGNGRPVSVKEMADKIWPDNNLPIKEVTGERQDTCATPIELMELGWKPKHFIMEEK